MNTKIYAAAVCILLTLAIAAAPAFAQTVNTVDGLRNALNAPDAGSVIIIGNLVTNGRIGNDPAKGGNFMYPDVTANNGTWLTPDGWRWGKLFWYGEKFDTGAMVKDDTQAVSSLTLQGANGNGIIKLDNTANPAWSANYGQLLSMSNYENLTLKDLTLAGANLHTKNGNFTTSSSLDSVSIYGGSSFNNITGELKFSNFKVMDNTLEAFKTDTVNETVGVGNAGLRVTNSENITFEQADFTSNKAIYSEQTLTSAAGSDLFGVEAGGLYVGTFDKLTYTGGKFDTNYVSAVNASASAGAMLISDGDSVAGQAALKNLEFTGNKATVNVTAMLTDNVEAKGGAFMFRDESAGAKMSAAMEGFTVRDNEAIAKIDAGGDAGGKEIMALGGAGHITGSTTATIKNSDFSSNKAIGVTSAYGGAIYHNGTEALTITDTDFTNNSVTATDVGGTASGGAIFIQNADIAIKAVSKDVLFSGNTANGKADSIYTTGNLTYDIAAGRTIADNDKITVGKDLKITGGGKALSKANFNQVLVAGKTDISGTAVAIKNAAESKLGTTTLNQSLLILGEGAAGTQFNGDDSITLNDSTVLGGIFTGWNYNDTAHTLTAYRYTEAQMSDGFLAAFGMHGRNTVWQAVRDQMISGSGRFQYRPAAYGRGYYGQVYDSNDSAEFAAQFVANGCDPCAPIMNEPLACDPCAPIVPQRIQNFTPNTAWVNYVGRSGGYQSRQGGNWDRSMEGLQAGTDLFRTKNAQLGIFFGSEDGTSTLGNDRLEGDDLYLGIYASAILRSGADIRGVFGYGWQDYNLNRTQNGSVYRSSFRGETIEGNLEIGKRFAQGRWSMRPALGIDVLSNAVDGAIESGDADGADAVRYDDAKLTQLFVRAGTDLRFRVRGGTLHSGIYYAYEVNGSNDLSTGVTSLALADTASQLRGSSLGRSMLLFNLGGSIQLSRNLALIGGYQGETMLDGDNDVVQSTGHIGGSWRW